jgi:nucleoside-diphosphate-sugar epimerase
MKVFVAGATGAIGKRLLPLLSSRGHEVGAMTRSSDRAAQLRESGVDAYVADALDRAQVMDAIKRARPDVVIHQLTDLARVRNFKNFDAEFAQTNKLRTMGTDNLMAAARAAGARQFIAQSYGGWPYERTGSRIKTETDPLDTDPPRNQRESLAAIRELERIVTTTPDILGIALRYGSFYGPGTNLTPGGDVYGLVQKRAFPLVGDGGGIWSFIHIDDAARATLDAIEHGSTGVYNIADDDPAPVSVWLPELAAAIGAKPPRRVPRWLGRIAAGDVGVSMMTRIRGMSNEKAKKELGLALRYASWRTGFRNGLSD